MNKNLQSHISSMRNLMEINRRTITAAETLFTALELSDSADFNLHGGTLWITTSDRNDVAKVLALAPAGKHWAKEKASYNDSILRYMCEIDGAEVQLHVSGDAIPPTCKLTEVEVVVPAQPERIEKRRVLVCPEVKAEPEPRTEDWESAAVKEVNLEDA